MKSSQICFLEVKMYFKTLLLVMDFVIIYIIKYTDNAHNVYKQQSKIKFVT